MLRGGLALTRREALQCGGRRRLEDVLHHDFSLPVGFGGIQVFLPTRERNPRSVTRGMLASLTICTVRWQQAGWR